jgi:hypothetical protein
MYVRTGQGFGQVRMLYRQLSGSLGDQDLQQRIAKAIDERRKNNTLAGLLIDITVHPAPKDGTLVDLILINNFYGQEDQVLDQLTKVHDDLYKSEPSYKKQIDDEWNLRRQMFATTTALDIGKIKPFLMKVLVEPLIKTVAGDQRMSGNWPGFAQAFAKQMLPPALTQRISRSRAATAQLANLAATLQSIAQSYQSSGKDAAFSRAVEAERKRISDAKKRQEEQTKRRERLRQQRIRQQKKPKPPPAKRKMTLEDI